MIAHRPAREAEAARRASGPALALMLAVVAALVSGAVPAAARSGWRIEPGASPPGSAAALGGVTCPTSRWCMAVGTLETGGGAMAEDWDGAGWRLLPVEQPAGNVRLTNLTSVWCAPDQRCFATGWVQSWTFDYTAILEAWDGASWTIQPIDLRPFASDTQLTGISCVDPANCLAVGWYSGSGFRAALVERWDGAAWSLLQAPGYQTELNAVSCTGDGACQTVGWSGLTRPQPFAERWDASGWTVETVPAPGEGRPGVLYGVACVRATACVAVGVSGTPLQDGFPLADRWGGRAWTDISPDLPGDSTEAAFSGIACPRANACVAVGWRMLPGATATSTFGEHWSPGHWRVRTFPEPAGSNSAQLDGASCTGAAACTAVGFAWTSSSAPELIERHGRPR